MVLGKSVSNKLGKLIFKSTGYLMWDLVIASTSNEIRHPLIFFIWHTLENATHMRINEIR